MKKRKTTVLGKILVETDDVNTLKRNEINIIESNGKVKAQVVGNNGNIENVTDNSDTNTTVYHWGFYFANRGSNIGDNRFLRYYQDDYYSSESFGRYLKRLSQTNEWITTYLEGSTPAFFWGSAYPYDTLQQACAGSSRVVFIFHSSVTNKYYTTPLVVYQGPYATTEAEPMNTDDGITITPYLNKAGDNGTTTFVGMSIYYTFIDKTTLGF